MNEPDKEPVDLTGGQENVTQEDYGIEEAQLQEDAAIGENTETELLKEVNTPLEMPEDEKDEQGFVDAEAGTQDDGANDHRLSTVDPSDVYEGRKKDIPVEVPITHFKNMDTGNIFPTNSSISQQRHLRPCDKDGNLVHDTRTPQDLR